MEQKKKKARVIAFYLPQFHPIPENDEWWGKGFTEWTNVGKAKRYFPGHYQPRIPADLGYYDLRVPETREAQAELARKAGIEGFAYWHYWFGNEKRLLERPFSEVLNSGKPDYPFCLAWANEDWKGFAHGLKDRNTFIKQEYPGVDDYTNHFYNVLPAFKDKRYIKVDGKPLFLIYKPLISHEVSVFIETWRRLAKENGLEDIYFVGQCHYRVDLELTKSLDLDAINNMIGLNNYKVQRNKIFRYLYGIFRTLFNQPYVISYKKISRFLFDRNIDTNENIIPSIIAGWDHTPRSSCYGTVWHNYTPELFYKHIKCIIQNTNDNPGIIFIKSWNEWAEGNYLEPDLKWGRQFLDALWRAINENICSK
ncbi:glycosyl transferase [Spirochaetia bacterium]|nr:glycosyl transferase [Spirochaetia bacterium]